MKLYNKVLAIILTCSLISVGGCSKFEEFNTNPDAPTKVTSGMLATTLILNIARPSTQKSFLNNHWMNKYVAWSEFAEGYQYNKFGRASFGGLSVLTNIEKMVGFAPSEGLKNSYQGLGHFIRAYKFFYQTMEVGDIPYSDALKGESDNIYNPRYDAQRDVFIGILKELEQADVLFANGVQFEGDPVYNGDVSKWRKAVNTFALTVLINLYKKTEDPELKVAQKIQSIVSSRPIFTSNDDNFQLTFSDKAGQKYPFYKEGNNFIIYPMVSTAIIDSLKAYGDRRLFYYANPSPVQIAAGKTPSEWDAYKGVDPAMPFTQLKTVAVGKDYSPLNNRYTELPEGEPVYLFSYAQLNFILAEAVVRNLVAGNAREYYEKGIAAAMNFVSQHTPDIATYHHGMPISSTYINEYVTGPQVAFKSDPESQIRQIMVQKYIATYLQAPWSAYYEYRRTGYPVLPINPSSNLNVPGDKIPVRWMYPQSEYDYNGDNLKAAIAAQYGGQDDVNSVMWILKD